MLRKRVTESRNSQTNVLKGLRVFANKKKNGKEKICLHMRRVSPFFWAKKGEKRGGTVTLKHQTKRKGSEKKTISQGTKKGKKRKRSPHLT